MVQPQLVVHPLTPVFDAASRILILGTIPSPASREAGFYYGHPQNRFWKVLGILFSQPEPQGIEARKAFLLDHHLALWDVLASCVIEGAADASITRSCPNNLSLIMDVAPIEAVCTTGAKAAALYRRYNAGVFPQVTHIALPSTSAANARMNLVNLVNAYRPIIEILS